MKACSNSRSDKFNNESIQLLIEAGIDFETLKTYGIDHITLAEYLFSSGMILNNEISWVTFHGAFDFAYLLKMITNSPLPHTMQEFERLVRDYFPVVYDTKIISGGAESIKGGSLQKLGNEFGVSESLITRSRG